MATKNHEEDDVRRVQIKAYVDWMNAQLKKKPGTRLIEDLKCDVQDGVALTSLVSIIAGRELNGVHQVPATTAEQVHNINLVIAFMMEKKIKMHPLSAKDVVEGNIKAIMRLILALAAHYKPNSVKQSSRGSPSNSMAGLAQSAAVALADVRRDVALAGLRPHRPAQLNKQHGSLSMWEQSQSLDGTTCSSGSSSLINVVSPLTSADHRRESAGQQAVYGALKKIKSCPVSSDDLGSSAEHDNISLVSEGDHHALLAVIDDEHSCLTDELKSTYKLLSYLQHLLLHGQSREDEHSGVTEPDSSPSLGQPFILKSLLQNSEKTNRELKEELSRVHTKCLQLQGVKTGLLKRLAELEESFLVLKAELLRAGFCQQSLETSKAELEQKLAERDATILELKQGLCRRDQQLEEITVDRQAQQQDRDRTSRNIKSQILGLHDKLHQVNQTEVTLSSRMVNQDHKLQSLENKILHHGSSLYDNSSKSHQSCNQVYDKDDLHLVRESLHSLRRHFAGGDPQHETIDTLEQSISCLLTRLSSSQPDSRDSSMHNLSWTGADGKGDSNLILHDSPLHKVSSPTLNGQNATKVLYFTDRTVTPFMCTIPKRLGEICLRDIKNLLDRPGNYRYHFKAMDPEFGTVKEEITHDDDVIPGWEGKVVAWIEEDHE